MKHFRSRSYGFSLVEVMIALAVLTFGVYGVLDLLINSNKLARRASTRTQAVYIAKGKIAELQAAGFNTLLALADEGKGTYSKELSPVPGNPRFSMSWKIARQETEDSSLRVDVSVDHSTVKIIPVALHSYLFEREE